ncbi:MAG: alkaline phosphatase family protein [Dehalococcoidia bacterium]
MTQVVIVVFDGLNEELVTPDLMPRLSAFAAEGARFANHRPVFPSVTRLNAAAIATGCFPGTHGLHANLSLVPEYHPTEPMDAMEPQLTELRRRTGRVLFVPTLADLLGERGLEYVAAGVGTSGQAFVHHPNGEDAALGATIHTDYALPRGLFDEVVQRFGPWPEKVLPNTPRIRQLTRVFTDYVLAERNPAVALLWFSEPDSSQHGAGLNSPTTRQAATDADAEFGRLLDWLEATGRAPETNVIVTCDHGQSTIIEPVPLSDLLAAEGFAGPGEPGGVIVAGNGGSALFYIDQHDPAVADRLAAWLMAQPWAGPILASDRVGAIEGTLPARLLGLQGDRTPDLLMSFGWNDGVNEHGQPGMVYSSGGAAGRGTHGSMSPWEFRTFTVARGPAFRPAARVEVATGHADLAPTILRILGIERPAQMEGRAVEEALVDGVDRPMAPAEGHVASRTVPGGVYRQRLVVAPTESGRGHLVSASYSRAAADRAGVTAAR